MGTTIKIYGYGWVGKAMHTLFPNALIHDPSLGMINEATTDVAFICVPSPLKDGKLDCSIVEQVVKQCDSDLIIIRSTVMPGTCDWLEKFGSKTVDSPLKNIVFQPEYLGETTQHPLFDQKSRPFLILGGRPENRRKAIEVYQQVYNANVNITQVTLLEAEVIKLSENRAIMFKVAQCQELYDACEAAGVDYYTVRDVVYHDDPRFNLWWTFVLPNKRGANSKCIPKDVYGWAAWAESVGYDPKLTKAMLEVNDEIISNNSSI